jgi:hypothetical protein
MFDEIEQGQVNHAYLRDAGHYHIYQTIGKGRFVGHMKSWRAISSGSL